MQPLFIGDHPLIDFLNTSLSPSGRKTELIGDGGAYMRWLSAARLLDNAQAVALSRRFSAQALEAAAAQAREVREWIRAWVTRWRANPRGDYRREVAVLNDLLARDVLRREVVVRTRRELELVDRPALENANALIGLIAAELAALLTQEQPELIRECANDTCTLWFLDRTRSHRRMFCSASACGNRVRVAAFRDRQRRA